MAKTSILAIPQLSDGQTQAFTTVNEALAIIEQAMNRKLTVATGNTSQTITIEQMTRNVYFLFNGATGAINITYPSKTEDPATVSSPVTARLLVVENGGTGTITVKTNVTGDTISLIAGEIAMIYIDGANVKKMFSSTGLVGSGGGIITLGGYVAGALPPSTEILRYTFTENTSFPDNFSGSRGSIGVNPTSAVTITIYKNVTAIGTITISTGGAFTFTTTGSTAETFAAGDYISLVTGSPDATAANISYTLKGTR